MKIFRAITFSILSLVMLSAGYADNNDSVVRYVIEGALWGDQAIQSARGNLHYSWIRPDSMSSDSEALNHKIMGETPAGMKRTIVYSTNVDIFWAFHNDKMICEEKTIRKNSYGNPSSIYEKYIFDGEKTLRYREIGTDPQTTIKAGTINIMNTIKHYQLPTYCGMRVFNIPVSDFLQGIGSHEKNAFLGGNTQFVKEDRLNEMKCYLFRSAGILNNDTLYVWISPERMFRPIRVEHRYPAGYSITTIEFRLSKPNIWFPHIIYTEAFNLDTVGKKTNPAVIETITVQDNLEINPALTEELFSFTFPKGIKVYDERINETVLSE